MGQSWIEFVRREEENGERKSKIKTKKTDKWTEERGGDLFALEIEIAGKL